MLPCTRQMLEDTAASKSHGGGGKCSLAEHLQEAPAGYSHLPPPESHAHQRQTPYIFPRERSAGLVLARDIETHVQSQDKVLWAANVSQAPRSFCSSEKQGPGPDAWPSACSSCFQGPGATDQVLESSGRVVQGHEAETDAQHAGLGTEVHQHVQLRLNRPAQRCL